MRAQARHVLLPAPRIARPRRHLKQSADHNITWLLIGNQLAGIRERLHGLLGDRATQRCRQYTGLPGSRPAMSG